MSGTIKMAQGKVLKAGSYKLNEPKLKYQSTTEYNTHRLSLEIEGVGWIGFGETDQENFYVKVGNQWKVLGAGSEVFVPYEERVSGGNTYRNAKRSKMTVANLVEGKEYSSSKESSSSSNEKSYDETGMKVGHAQKGATILSARHKLDFMESAERVLVATEILQGEIEQRLNKSKFSAGQEAGCAILNACSLVTKKGDLLAAGQKLVFEYNPKIEALVKGVAPDNQEEDEEEEIPATSQEEAPSQPEDSDSGAGGVFDSPEDDDWDDDIPF